MLNKGLSRAGICDSEHQQQIRGALLRLRRSRPDQVMQELEGMMRASREEDAALRLKRAAKPRVLPALKPQQLNRP